MPLRKELRKFQTEIIFEFDHESKIGFFSFFSFLPGIIKETER